MFIFAPKTYDCRSEYDFYNRFASELLKQTATKTEQVIENIKKFLVRLTPKIAFSPEPMSEFSLSLGITPQNYQPEEDFCRGVDALLAQCSALFEEQLKGLTSYQLNFIRALCDGVTSDFGSKAILESYNLGSKSNISRIKAALQDKEMIDFDKNTVYLEDPVFKIWYKRNK